LAGFLSELGGFVSSNLIKTQALVYFIQGSLKVHLISVYQAYLKWEPNSNQTGNPPNDSHCFR